MKFRKKPVVIEAIQYTGDNLGEVLEFISAHSDTKRKYWVGEGGTLCIETLEGTMRTSFDDWVIIGVAGEVYPCKPDIFEATYDPISEVSHQETPDRNFFFTACPYCETVNNVTFNPETEVQFRTCEKCEKQFIADWSKVR